VVSWTGVHLLKSLVPWNMPIVRPIGLDASMLGFTLTVSLAVGVAVGIIPAWFVNHGRTTEARKLSIRPLSAPRTGNLVSGALVISEVAMALVLLTGAVLMIQSVRRLLHVDPGYDASHLLKVRVSNPFQGFGGGTKEGESQLLAQMQERLSALPGVEAVGLLSHPNFFREQFRDEGSGQSFPVDLLGTGVGAADLFRAMRIPLVEGRYLEESDMKEGRSTVMVNATLARLCWPGQSAVGKRLHDVRDKKDTGWEVIGVVGDVVWRTRDESVRPAIYRPSTAFRGLSTDFLLIRTRTDPRLFISAMRQELKTVEPEMRLPVIEVPAQSLYDSTAKYRTYMHCLIGFALTGLLLSVVGIFGVSTWTVVRRTKEIGIRMAVGASPAQAMGLVLRQGVVVTSVGILIGLVAALALTRFLRSYLFTVSPIDPFALAAASILLGAVAMLACYIPARRAARVDPMVALRYE